VKAVIDLGSNTFHLLIVKHDKGGLKTVYRKRIFVRLLEQVKVNQIDAKACERAKEACLAFYNTLSAHAVDKYTVIGTAAFRDSDNGDELKIALEGILKIPIRILSDIEEAMYIFRGVSQTVVNIEGPYVIMDIGGGSIEFILARETDLLFAKSYPIGLHKLAESLNYEGMMTNKQRQDLSKICREILDEIIQLIKKWDIHVLVGNAGSFEICNALAGKRPLNSYSTYIDLKGLQSYFDEIKNLNAHDVERLEWIPQNRKRMMPLAFSFIEAILDLFDIKELIYSPNSVKEGILDEI